MTNTAPQVKRRSLADLAAAAPVAPAAAAPFEDSRAQDPRLQSPPEKAAARRAAPTPSSRTAKYPSATVYLPPRAIRLLKEIGLEENRRLTDILAEALDDWLIKNGHPSLDQLGQ
jgi:hypothetical protein